MNGKGSRRRPENADAIARRWPFKKFGKMKGQKAIK